MSIRIGKANDRLKTRIIKAAPETDLYMEWSMELQVPTFIGTREELAEYLLEPKEDSFGVTLPKPERVAKRLARVDLVGDSILDCPWPFGTTVGLIFEGRHVLRRAHAEEFMQIFIDNGGKSRDELGNQWQRLLDLLEPLDDTPAPHHREH